MAALCGQLLDVPVSVARMGFQHGGDAGAAGRQDRRFRLECKMYADTSSLDRRELLGEILAKPSTVPTKSMEEKGTSTPVPDSISENGRCSVYGDMARSSMIGDPQ